jgi:hypothetical protein
MLWRQGDVFIERILSVPRGAVRRPDLLLAEGEITGHSHRIADPDAATLYSLGNQLLLVVHRDGAKVVHEEHGPIELTPGNYRVWKQREYDPHIGRLARPLSASDPLAAWARPVSDGYSRPVWD